MVVVIVNVISRSEVSPVPPLSRSRRRSSVSRHFDSATPSLTVIQRRAVERERKRSMERMMPQRRRGSDERRGSEERRGSVGRRGSNVSVKDFDNGVRFYYKEG